MVENDINPEAKAASRIGGSFLPIRGTTPKLLHENDGCSFPVYLTDQDPLKSPTAHLFCGARRIQCGDVFVPYCDHHQRIAYRPRTR